MLGHTNGILRELPAAGGGTSIAITPGATVQPGTFNISGLPPGDPHDMLNYLVRLWFHNQVIFDPDAAGSAVNWDKLYKGMQSFEVACQLLGKVADSSSYLGAVLGHMIQVVALDYSYPEGARTVIPTNTDTDVTLDLFYAIPFAHNCLAKPMETTQWVGFYDNGTVRGVADVSTVYDGDYAGAVTKTQVFRCQAEMLPSPDKYIGVPSQWLVRDVPGDSTPVLRQVGTLTFQNGIQSGCGLAALLWLTDATGIGLGGVDGVDNLTSLTAQWRMQDNILNLDGYFLQLRAALAKRVGPAVNGATTQNDRAGWPDTQAVTTGADNRPAADSQKLCLPIVFPSHQLETSKVQRILADLPIIFGRTSAMTNNHRFLSWELLEYTDQQLTAMQRAAGFSGGGAPKAMREHDATKASALRYVRRMYY